MSYKMKILLVLYTVFLIFINVLPVQYNHGLHSFFDLLFMNTKRFELYNLEPLNFQYIISLCLFHQLIIYKLLSESNEYFSFLGMVVYRKGVVKTLKDKTKRNFKRIFSCLSIIFLTVIIVYIIYIRFKRNCIVSADLVKGFVYILRYGVFISIELLIYDSLSLLGNSHKATIYVNSIFIAVMMVDLLINSRLVLFSSNLISELIYLVVNISLFYIIYLVSKYNLIKGADLI